MTDEGKTALDSVSACATWHILYNSEGCEFAISGIQVMLAFPDENGPHVFHRGDKPWSDFEDCIIKAAAEFDRVCYPERTKAKA